MQTLAIEEHGLIGNMRSAALIDTNATVDFYCFPEFDSPSVFAALLDAEKGGYFEIKPLWESMRTRQLYLPDTNVLLTRLLSEEGLVEITDMMPVLADDKPDSEKEGLSQLVRNVNVVRGEVRFALRCAPRFDYARAEHTITARDGSYIFEPKTEGIQAMRLHSPLPLTIDGQDVAGEFTLKRGESITFTFGGAKVEESCGLDEKAYAQCVKTTTHFWREWVGKSHYQGRWREMVNRSALALKLLTSRQYGSLVAAPTFSLPERIGGARNWDYRLCWLRDSSFTLYAFMRLGFTEESRKFSTWMRKRMEDGLKSMGPDGPLKPMYKLHDSSDFVEVELQHMAGYRGSKPVRIGNAAQGQLQLDIYGELMDAIYLGAKYANDVSHDSWGRMQDLLEWLVANWNKPDQGIWEVRYGRQEFLHSRMMCWVAFDRAIRLADKRSLSAPREKWLQIRDAIREDIFENFWSEKLQSFVQFKGSEMLDASALLMPLMRFIQASDPRWLSTMKAIEENLADDGIVYRYAHGSDRLDGTEGAFLPCSFWLIECLARADQVEKAELLFGKVLGYANHLGLYSEELGRKGEQLGNFPQALTHLALISTASYLDRKLSGKTEEWA
ncbi:MAG TPA: glycoside hydrolase family 15 protein [Acidobacteriaceae bacterium]|nr:glycoside hydrolase family 15 protein [Acidobacteriaceae bacterium]